MGLLNPDEAVSGMLNDVIILIKAARWSWFDYQGTLEPVPALSLMVIPDGEEAEQTEFLSAGSADRWEPSDDGHQLRGVGTAIHLSKSCKAVRFLKSLKDCGFKAEGDDPAVLDGLKVHVIRVPDTSRTFRDTGETKQGGDILVVDKIISLPGAAGGKTSGTKKNSTKVASCAKTAAPDPEIREIASQYILNILAKADGSPVPTNQLIAKAYNAGLKDDPNKATITKLLVDPEFLNTSALWTYEDGNLSL